MAVKKVKFGVGAEAAEAEVEGSFYDGPVPPKGVYRVRLKFLKLKTNKNNDPMLNGILEIDEKGEKAKFNGYGIWFNQNVTKQGAGYVNNFLDAFGYSRKAFWGTGVTLDTDDDPPTVTKIGTKTINDPVCRIRTKMGKWDGDERLEVAGTGFMPATATDGEDDETWDETADETAGAEAPVDEEEDEDEDGSEEDESEVEEADTANWAWLLTLDRAGLKEFNTANALGVRVTKSMSDDDLRQAVADKAGIAADSGTEDEDEDEDEDEEEEDEPEAEGEEGYTEETLPDDRAALVKIARDEFQIRVLKKHTPADLKAMIVAAQSGAGEEEDPAAPPF